MKSVLVLCLLAAPSLLAAGCGDITAVSADSQSEERVYITGSNVGRHPKDPIDIDTTIVTPEGAERQLNIRGVMPPKGKPAG